MEFTLAFGPKPEFSFSFKYPHFMYVEYSIYIRKKETDVLCKMINRHFWTKKSTNLLTFLYSKKHIILYKKDKI